MVCDCFPSEDAVICVAPESPATSFPPGRKLAAFSFVLDTTQTPQAAVAGFRKAVGDSGTRLTVVRIMRDGVPQSN